MAEYLAVLAAHYDAKFDEDLAELARMPEVEVDEGVDYERVYGGLHFHDVRIRVPLDKHVSIGLDGLEPLERRLKDDLDKVIRVDDECIRRVVIEALPPDAKGTDLVDRIGDLAKELSVDQVELHLRRIRAAIPGDTAAAVGGAKELVETVCKTILSNTGEEVPSGTTVSKLVKKTCAAMGQGSEQLKQKGSKGKPALQILTGLANAMDGVGQLRNVAGTGHGHDGSVKPPNTRTARLVVGAASTVAWFLLDWYAARERHMAGRAR
jgi:hypothetical protein